MNANRNIYKQYISGIPIGYCHCIAHKGALTQQLLKKHKCTQKCCPYLERNIIHPYWEKRRQNRENAKLKKRLFIEKLKVLESNRVGETK